MDTTSHHSPVLDRFAAQESIEAAWADRTLLDQPDTQTAIEHVIEDLDKGKLRVAEPPTEEGGEWTINEWVKKAVILYFPIRKMETQEVGPFEYHDKMALKTDYAAQKVRVVPPAVARYGAYLAPGVILMPSYTNIGAYVGKGVHLSGGVGLGGVLEPVQAAPVIVEDGAFIGSRSILVEGCRIGKEAVIGAGVTITGSTKIIDVTGPEPKEYKGYVPPRSVVIPGSITKKFPAGDYQVPCALIIGQRKPSTDLKTSLNDALRDFGVSV